MIENEVTYENVRNTMGAILDLDIEFMPHYYSDSLDHLEGRLPNYWILSLGFLGNFILCGILFFYYVSDPIEFIMEQKMMRGIKDRAEAAAQHDPSLRKASG